MLRDIWATQLRFLSFKKPMERAPDSWWPFLVYVIVVAWFVGIGRYWDSPDAHWVQKVGLVSVVYIFGMSALLWLVIWPISNKYPFPYVVVLVFVGLTSLPALLYAIPVEMFMSEQNAAAANYWFLIIVATWRVSLLWVFCKNVAGLTHWGAATAVIMPLTGIMILLAMYSLEHVTLGLMSGMRIDETMPRSNSGEIASHITAAAGWSHGTVGMLRFWSWLLFPIFFTSWVVMIVNGIPSKSSTNED